MNKSKLQEFCQQNLPTLPDYSVTKEGLDHNPRFRASVTVDGLTFDGQDSFKSSKEAQNEAARLALLHFNPNHHSQSDGSSRVDGVGGVGKAVKATERGSGNRLVADEFGGNQYKNQLQMFAQKRNMDLPMYDSTRVGSPHAPTFKATVSIGGLTFESSEFFNTIKEAENAAAKAAFSSLSPEGTQEASPQGIIFRLFLRCLPGTWQPASEDSSFYKNLLQQFTQKEGCSMPLYKTRSVGESHLPTFSSTVEVEGENFDGESAKTKKLAEMNAAKVAWTTLNKRKLSKISAYTSLSTQAQEVPGHVSTTLPSGVTVSLLQSTGKDQQDNSSLRITKIDRLGADLSTLSLPSKDSSASETNAKQKAPRAASDSVFAHLDPLPRNPSPSNPSNVSVTAARSDTPCTLLFDRICVYPRIPDMQFPEGVTLLPFSDNEWVAVSLDYANTASS
ncbi:Double-stranded RNA-binding protein 1 [Acorus calamus]|uniref:Double-stranded RNA-binding protein 1 n=1 Tax=Acorus calamus TaxID=4465 RepID=A0AAV9D7U9_ACOCL|nr:Double-stranded RNA-binding protein 1 [Acorus calamus]